MSVTTSTHAAVTVNDSADVILNERSGRRGAIIQNRGASSVFLGKDSDVTTSNGIELASGQSFEIKNGEYMGAVYGITAASGSANVRYWEFHP